jgi:hypothetical protein
VWNTFKYNNAFDCHPSTNFCIDYFLDDEKLESGMCYEDLVKDAPDFSEQPRCELFQSLTKKVEEEFSCHLKRDEIVYEHKTGSST